MWCTARVFFLSCLLVGLAGVSAGVDVPLRVLEFTENIRRPVHDKRAYRYVLLSNGTKVLLVSDPDGDEAAASVAVGVGSFADPADLQGLAHFTEHMLFQGSRKFSTNTGFFDFIHDKGGRANAYTSHTFTVMSFAVPARHLAEALERVADIFANPTLDPRDATQEVKAVHEEFAIRLSDDSVRLAHLARQSRLRLPFSNFSVGSIESLVKEPRLKGLDVAEEMKKFHAKWYSSENITLALVGKEPLDKLEKIVTRLFRTLPGRQPSNSRAKFGDVLEFELFFRETDSYKQLLIDGCSLSRKPFAPEEMQTVRFSWDSKPLEFVEKLLNFQGAGSLSRKLKSQGVVSGVSASADGQDYCTLFRVTFALTDTDISEQTVETLGRVLFLYLRAIRLAGMEEWRFSEQADLTRVMFEARDVPAPYELTQEAAEALHFLPPTELLAGSFLVYSPDRFLVGSLLDYYLTPSNVRVFVEDKTLSVSHLPRREKRYQIPYWTNALAATTLENWNAVAAADSSKTEEAMAAEGLTLPPENPFVRLVANASQTARAEGEAPQAEESKAGSEIPERLGRASDHFCEAKRESPSALEEVCAVFHKKDKVFRVPKVSVTLSFYYPPPPPPRLTDGGLADPQTNADRDAVMNELFIHLANLSFVEIFSQAFEAGAVALVTSGMPAPSAALRRNAVTLRVAGLSALVPSLLLNAGRALGCSREDDLTNASRNLAAWEGRASSPPEPAQQRLLVEGLCSGTPRTRSFLLRRLLPAALHRVLTAAAAAVRTRSPGLQALDRLQEVLVTPVVAPQRFLKALRSLVAEYKRQHRQTTGTQSEEENSGETTPSHGEDAWRGGLLSESSLAEDLSESQSGSNASPQWKGTGDWWSVAGERPSRTQNSSSDAEASGRHWISGDGEAEARFPSREISSRQQTEEPSDAAFDVLEASRLAEQVEEGGEKRGGGWLDALFEDLVAWNREAMRRVYVEGLIEGDVDLDVADSLFSDTLKLLSPEALISEQTARAHLSVLTMDSAESRLAQIQLSLPARIELALQRAPNAPYRRLRRKSRGTKRRWKTLPDLAPNPTAAALWQGWREAAAEEDGGQSEASLSCPPVFALAIPNSNRLDPKNHVAVVVEAGELPTVREKALAFLASYDLSQKFFNALRTQQQLGYSVHLAPLRLERRVFFLFGVTTLYDPTEVEERVAAFVASQQRRLGLRRRDQESEGDGDSEGSEREERERLFEALRKAASGVWEKSPKNLAEDVERNLGQIVGREYIFNLNKEMVREIGQVSLDEFEQFIKRRMFNAPRLTVKVFSVARVPKEIKAHDSSHRRSPQNKGAAAAGAAASS